MLTPEGMNKHDIKSTDREGYLNITSEQAYEWVKSGVWNLKKFQIWLDHVICNAEYEAKYA
jgi:hypothetical protein